MTLNRRDLMTTLAALPLWVVAGCSCPPRRDSVEEWKAPIGLAPLRPSRIAEKASPVAFDAHVHLFNATDVNVRGYLEGPVAHSRPTVAPVLKAAAPMVEAVGQSLAISCGDEMAHLAAKLQAARGHSGQLAQVNLSREIDAEVERHVDEIAHELIRRLPGSEFGMELDRADRAMRWSDAREIEPSPTQRPLSEDPKRIRAALFQSSFPTSDDRALGSKAASGPLPDPTGVLSFVRFMVSPRHHNLRAFQKSFAEGDGAIGIDACFSALVDFDYWLGCPAPTSSLRDQVMLHEQLAVLSGGYVLPLVPYNPWTDIERQGESLDLVRWAVKERGFVGVKLYPPMGFRPLRNTEPFGSTLRRPPGQDLDRSLVTLYRWCADEGVPIMAHTGHSMGRDGIHDGLSDPQYWQDVLDKFPGLRINAGHFGGDFRNGKEDWPRGFVHAMGQANGKRLYADLAYEEQLLNPDVARSDPMFELLKGRLSNNEAILNRIMYGSDWHMIAQLDDWGHYGHAIRDFITALAGPDNSSALDAVFYGNAARCFGLRPGEQNRIRLEQFYARWAMPLPPWMVQLDRVSRLAA